MNREEIKTIIPHRGPMLLLDEVSLVDGEAVGSYTIKGDEYFLQGHFPDNPIVPGVILCEMMGQSACVLIDGLSADATPYFAGMNNVKFKGKVVPGDTVMLRSKLIKTKGPFYFVKAEGLVGGRLCVSAELTFTIVR